jgi:enoyl-[acyl-carrier protein] reductase II
MVWVAGAKLAAAVSEAGGLGLIGAGSMDADLLAAQIQKARRLTAKPVGVNLPLLYKHAEANLQVILDQRVEVVFTSAGSPKKTTGRLKEAGAVVFHVVSTPALALKCLSAGVDGVVAEGFEAGGHNGRAELTTMALVPQVVSALAGHDVAVVAAGGIATGAQMAAALALGADGVQVGTRFAATLESSAHPAFKRALSKAGPGATRLVLKKGIPVRLLENAFRQRVEAAEAQGASRQDLIEMLGSGRERRGMFEGEVDEGELEAGQVAAMIETLLPAGQVVSELMDGFRRTVAALSENG